VTIEIGSSVIPPYGAALAQRELRLINSLPGRLHCQWFILGIPDRPAGGHQFPDQICSSLLSEGWVAFAP
jgi:hypothetical protein